MYKAGGRSELGGLGDDTARQCGVLGSEGARAGDLLYNLDPSVQRAP